MQTRTKSHLSKYNSKKTDTMESSAFYKHALNANGGDFQGNTIEELFDVEIVKAYSKPATRQTGEEIFMINVGGELLTSKTDWHQPRIIRSTVHTGGGELDGGRIVSFPVDGASGSRTQAGGPDPQIGGGRGTQLRRSTRNVGR